MSRFVVGIDLGTSNTALAFADTSVTSANPDEAFVAALPIAQVVAPGAVEERPLLASSIYIAAGTELAEGALNLPWRAEDKVAVGAFAREQGTKIPGRYIHSAKSWLCVAGLDPQAALLPPGTTEEDAKRSPVAAAGLVLKHLVESWNHTMAEGDASLALTEQEVTLCVPASFDAGARNLTVGAAQALGFKHLTLLEEPQAAFHSWLESVGGGWRKKVSVGDLVLVVDVGGGTSDFSLIAVEEKGGSLELRRVAVGEHILLGGDNMDLALAYGVAQRLEKERGKAIEPWQMALLTQQCRAGKEALLSDAALATWPIALLGRGSSVIGGTIKTELPRAGLEQFLVDGFFPLCGADEAPIKARRAGFREVGLPYAADPAITRHLAGFLAQQGSAQGGGGRPVMPTAVLFNGGVFRADALRARVMAALAGWAKAAGAAAPRELDSADLDLAVARGAAYHGLARRGKGVRIRAGSARSYYIGIESAAPAVPGVVPQLKAMCVVPFGMEEGAAHDISGIAADLCVWTGEPAVFRLLSSTTRQKDAPGELLTVSGGDFEEHDPVETVLGGKGAAAAPIEVDLRSHLTEVGVLQLACIDRKTRAGYALQFNLRG